MLFSSCASVKTDRATDFLSGKANLQNYPQYSGKRIRVQVVKFSIPPEVAKDYPELGKKRVGWGLYNRLLEELYLSGRFEFAEEKSEMQQRIMEEWALSQSGATVEEVPATGLSAPQALIYAEIYGFSVNHSEQVVGISVENKNTSIVGIQLRLVDVATGEYIPASGEGEAATTGKSIWLMPDMNFDQGTVGLASQRAIRKAILGLLERIEQKEFKK